MDNKATSKKPLVELPGIERGMSYPAGRPRYFAGRYQRMLLKTCTLMEIKHAGFALCSLVVLTEGSKQYTRAPRFWTKQLLEFLDFKSRSSLCEVIDRCVKAGVLHYEPGRKSVASVMWAVMPAAWEQQSDGYLDDDSFAQADSIPSASRQHPVSIPAERQTHSGVLEPVIEPSPSKAGGDEGGLIQRLRSLGLNKAQSTIREARRKAASYEYITSVLDCYSSNPGLCTLGYLHWRLTDDDALALPAVEGWPTPASGKVIQAKVDRLVQADRRKDQAEARSSAETKAKDRQLELQFGPILDAASPDEIRRLVTEKKPALLAQLQRRGYGNDAPLVRLSVLNLLAAEPSR